MKNTVKLQSDSISQVPIQIYEENFTFIVNGEEYRTNKIVADLLSPIISNQHRDDPTFSEFTIKTQSEGNFQTILNLVSFEEKEIQSSEFSFLTEVIQILGTDKIDLKIQSPQVTVDNVIELIHFHESLSSPYSQNFDDEIDFISAHFHEFKKSRYESLFSLSEETIERVIQNDKLQLDSEDELLTFINDLCSQNSEYSKLYEYVYFSNVEEKTMKEFLSRFNPEYMTGGVWQALSSRLIESVTTKNRQNSKRYSKLNENKVKKINKDIPYTMNKLEGIFNYFRKHSDIDEEVNVTYSSRVAGNTSLLLQIENANNDFYTESQPNSWICFEFKKHRISPTNYSIRSVNSWTGDHHPKTWVIEGSNDEKNWIKLDEQNNSPFLNGANHVHTFTIQNQENNEIDVDDVDQNEKEFKYLRMRLTGPNWYNFDHLDICSIEFYGRLI
ncbi:hypothetical protein M9Y10_026338 [Tritrichomonas musculus]|uniref:F5/8 type C domain-containing protein n=1 Tax=Tritrichomonas musculus TaxID=1915356 RepID=A0ABR2H7H5_9EUKA